MEWNIDWQFFKDLGDMHIAGLSWVDLILLLLVAGLCGAVAKYIAGQTSGGFLVSVALGFIGAALTLLVDRYVQLPEIATLVVGSVRFPVVWSIIGASLFITVIHWLNYKRRLRNNKQNQSGASA
jgi:uncharacterized membrane protein YeaQ/YmgE (transglycosylase-associated protein family)